MDATRPVVQTNNLVVAVMVVVVLVTVKVLVVVEKLNRKRSAGWTLAALESFRK